MSFAERLRKEQEEIKELLPYVNDGAPTEHLEEVVEKDPLN